MNYKNNSDLVKLYAKCKFKVYGRDGQPRPCRNASCPCTMCRRKYAEKHSITNQRSALELPPNYTFVLRVEDDSPLTGELMSAYLDKLVEKLKYHRKAKGVMLEYESRPHYKKQRPHIHLTVITSADWSVRQAKALMKAWWKKSCPGRRVSIYAGKIRNVVAHIRYVTGDLIDRRMIERPPQELCGKRFRLVRRSNGFLIRPAVVLWKEYWEEVYPKPKVATETDDWEPIYF